MIKTKQEIVTQNIGLWALPKRDPKPGEFPFTYELYGTNYHWQNNAILVSLVDVKAVVPEGIDLFAMALETLNHKEAEAMKNYNEAMKKIAEMRSSMLLLSGPSEPEVLPPEIVAAQKETIVDILVRRDNMDRSDAADLLEDGRLQVAEGADPEEVLSDLFGLEPDYIFELLE